MKNIPFPFPNNFYYERAEVLVLFPLAIVPCHGMSLLPEAKSMKHAKGVAGGKGAEGQREQGTGGHGTRDGVGVGRDV